MKRALWWTWILTGLVFGSLQADAAQAALARLDPVKSKLRIEGSSNVDTWQVESKSLRGYFEAGPGFLRGPGQKAGAERLDARAEIVMDVRSLHSVEKDGKPFSNRMDEIMYGALGAKEHPYIRFQLRQLSAKTLPTERGGPVELEAQGKLAVNGAAREIVFPAKCAELPGGQLRFWGAANLKMTDFHVTPPSPTISLGLIKTADEIKVTFEWVVAPHH